MTGKNIALFGGTFDPIHKCHLAMASYARDKFSLDEIHFVVAKNSPFKINTTTLSAAKRYDIVEKAIANESKFFISDFEIKQEDISYSYKTVEYFKEKSPDAKIYWIMGYDAFVSLPNWSHYQYLKENLEFIVFCRDHISNPEIFDKELVHYFVQDFNCEISSTLVRSTINASLKDESPSVLDKFLPNNLLDIVFHAYKDCI